VFTEWSDDLGLYFSHLLINWHSSILQQITCFIEWYMSLKGHFDTSNKNDLCDSTIRSEYSLRKAQTHCHSSWLTHTLIFLSVWGFITHIYSDIILLEYHCNEKTIRDSKTSHCYWFIMRPKALWVESLYSLFSLINTVSLMIHNKP